MNTLLKNIKLTDSNSKLIYFTLISTFILIMLGSTIRVQHAGLSCPDWPLCYSLVLPTYSKVSILEDQIGYSYNQLILEWAHRVVAGLVVGPAIFFLVLQSLYRASKGLKAKNLTFINALIFNICLSILLMSQIFLGNLTVLEQNIPWSVALHLCAAIILYQLLIYYYVIEQPTNIPSLSQYKKILFITYNIVIFIMVTGALQGGVHYKLSDITKFIFNDPGMLIHMTHNMLVVIFLIICIYFRLKQVHYSNVILFLVMLESGSGLIHYAYSNDILIFFHQVIGLFIFSGVSLLFWFSIKTENQNKRFT